MYGYYILLNAIKLNNIAPFLLILAFKNAFLNYKENILTYQLKC